MQLKNWEIENLPAWGSMVGHRIFFYLIDAYIEGESKSVKVLCSELPFSAAAIRLQIRKLHRDGWVSIQRGRVDSRQRFIGMTKRTLTLLREYERQIALVTTGE